jgi:hypothetical protein
MLQRGTNIMANQVKTSIQNYLEMDAILLIIGIVYGVCRIVIKSVQQCTYFLFSVNLLLVGVILRTIYLVKIVANASR